MTRQGIVYLIGVFVFGIAFYPLRSAIGNDVVFVIIALAYAGALRLLGWAWTRRGGDRPGGSTRPG
jgi:hypothetical protein